MNSSDCLCK